MGANIPLPALDIKQPEQIDIASQLGRVAQLRSLGQRQALEVGQQQLQSQQIQSGQFELQQQQRQAQDQKTVQQVLAQHQGDLESALPDLATQVSAQTFMGLQKAHLEIKKTTAEIDDKELAINKDKNDRLLGLISQAKSLPPDQYQQQWPQIAAQALQINPKLASHVNPQQPIPQQSLDGLGIGVMTQAQYEAQELAKRAAAKAPSELAKSQADAAKAVTEAQFAPAQGQATLGKTQAETQSARATAAVAGQKAKLGVGGVAAAEAAGKIQGEMGAMGGIAGPGGAPNPNLQPGQKDEDYLKTLQGNVGTTVKAIAEGRMPLPSGFALKSPYWQNMLSMVAKYDPSFDAVNYNARAQTRKDFTSGKSAGQVNALNTVIGHLDTLSTAADKLNNTWSPTWNSLSNAVSTATGHSQVKQFDVTKNAVVDELTRVWRQSGGTEQDIQSWEKQLNASGSPQQLHDSIAQIGELLHSKLGSMQNQVQQGMGTDQIKLITPQAQATLDKLSQKSAPAPSSQAVYAKNPKTGERVMTTDGGKTWVAAQ